MGRHERLFNFYQHAVSDYTEDTGVFCRQLCDLIDWAAYWKFLFLRFAFKMMLFLFNHRENKGQICKLLCVAKKIVNIFKDCVTERV
ncbi:MAG: hypothetical protein DWQ10_08245 [Calditrichaeota bacterium]|nr:MAG: hypothetical protein DWQ10_08245 [Calditrichota bacterium]